MCKSKHQPHILSSWYLCEKNNYLFRWYHPNPTFIHSVINKTEKCPYICFSNCFSSLSTCWVISRWKQDGQDRNSSKNIHMERFNGDSFHKCKRWYLCPYQTLDPHIFSHHPFILWFKNSVIQKPGIIEHHVSLGPAVISEITGRLVYPSKNLFYLLSHLCGRSHVYLNLNWLPAIKFFSLSCSHPTHLADHYPYLFLVHSVRCDTREVSSCSRTISSHHLPCLSLWDSFFIHLKTPNAMKLLLCLPLNCYHSLKLMLVQELILDLPTFWCCHLVPLWSYLEATLLK